MRDRRFAWWLVRLYPPSFRRDMGLGLADTIEDAIRGRRASGAGTLHARVAALADTLRNAPPEWAAAIRGHRPPGAVAMIDLLRRDVSSAVRAWTRRPGFALVAVLTLALGIAATTAMFSIVNAVLLRPIPYAGGERLVMIWGRTPANPQTLVTWREYDAIRSRGPFEAAGLWLTQSVNLTGGERPQRITGAFVTGSFFEVLGLHAERGRLFGEAESEPGSAKPVAVITHAFWQRQFAGDDRAVGSVLTLNGIPLTIAAVVAPPFDEATVPAGGWFLGCDVLIPAGLFPGRNDLSSPGPALIGVARLKPHVPLTAANSDLDLLSRGIQTAFPAAEGGRTTRAELVQESIVGSSRQTLLLLLASVGAVLLIACVNVGNLLLARASDRQKEMALRAALGASRFAVARQLLAEAVLLTLVAAVAGVILGRWSVQAVSWLKPPNVPIPERIPLDASVVFFAIGVSGLVALVCGAMPALRVSGVSLSGVLQAGSHRTTGTGGRAREALVVVELALSVALLATSALLVRSLVAAQQVPLGFDPSHVFTLQFRLPASRYTSKPEIARFFERAIAAVRAAPGVESAALVRAVPLSGNGGNTAVTIEGRPAGAGAEPQASYHLVTPGYFTTLRIPLVAGRDFTDRDDLSAPLVAVVNQTFARTLFPGVDPLGRRLKTADLSGWITVVGVVGDAKHLAVTDPSRPQLYVSHYQNPQIFTSLVARTAAAPMSVANDVRQAVWSVDKDQPMWSVQPLDAIVDSGFGQWRFMAGLVGAFAAVAALLAGIGIYGVMAYSVAQRTHEIGIRLALGAPASRVLAEVVARGARLTAVAIGLGLAAAVAAARLATSVLFGVKPYDPPALIGAAALLAAVAMAACLVPGRRASRVDPVVALAEA
ncbi:MAG TPA: ABC transporter permease [Vicinamibacterales bacterium]|nr:ABC transporter permease [Vicinamibacterales bacterium]